MCTNFRYNRTINKDFYFILGVRSPLVSHSHVHEIIIFWVVAYMSYGRLRGRVLHGSAGEVNVKLLGLLRAEINGVILRENKVRRLINKLSCNV